MKEDDVTTITSSGQVVDDRARRTEDGADDAAGAGL